MRLCVLTTDDFGGRGGIAKFNRDFLSALVESKAVQQLDVFPRLSAQSDVLLPKLVYHRSSPGKLRYVLRLLKFAFSRASCDVVFCGHLNLIVPAYLVTKIKRAKLKLIVHGVEAWDIKNHPLKAFFIRRVDQLISVSQFTLQKMGPRFMKLPHYVLPNLIDQSQFPLGSKDLKLMQRYKLADKKILLSLGRLDNLQRHKGFDQMLEALPQLLRKIPDMVYVLVGGGSDAARLQQKAKHLGIDEHVVFPGEVSDAEKLKWYQTADVFVMCGYGEGFGIVYLEALACGLPVIGSVLDGSREALMEGKLGRLANPNVQEKIINAVVAAFAQTKKSIPEDLSYYSLENFNARVAALLSAAP